MSCSFPLHIRCVGVKGNHAAHVFFPQLDDGHVLLFRISLLFEIRPQLGLICSLVGGDSRVVNISDVKEGKVQTERSRCHLLQQL